MKEPRPDPSAAGASMRVDRWLWFARLAKSRSLAARLCAAGAVSAGGRIATKPNHAVRIGDVVVVPQGRLVHTVRIVALGVAILSSPYPYLTVACSAVALLIFQTGLQRCRVSIVGPVSNITGSIFFMIAGTWLFRERLPTDF